MSSAPRLKVTPVAADDVPSLHGRAMDNLRFIRETMEQAGSFTAVSGWAMVAVGVSAFAAACVAWWVRGNSNSALAWLAVWTCEATIAFLVAGAAMQRKARRERADLLTGPGRKMALAFAPPMFVGMVLTVVCYSSACSICCPACGCCSTAQA
jgi:uncharacterized membrane protein YeiB